MPGINATGNVMGSCQLVAELFGPGPQGPATSAAKKRSRLTARRQDNNLPRMFMLFIVHNYKYLFKNEIINLQIH